MKRVLILVLLLLLCAPTALAAPSLDAQLTDGNLYITWSGCNCPEAILTVYRDNWPVLVTCVCGADGEYTVPSWYTQTAGLYAAQLRCNEGCIRVEAGSASPTEEPAAQPTPAPTAAFTAKPTVEPVSYTHLLLHNMVPPYVFIKSAVRFESGFRIWACARSGRCGRLRPPAR